MMLAGQASVGGVRSTTLTVVVLELDAPYLSMTVSVTTYCPGLKGPTESSTNVMSSPSGSNEPSSISVALRVAVQKSPTSTVTFLTLVTGGKLLRAITNGERELTSPQIVLVAKV